MRFASTGTRAALRSLPRSTEDRRAGFTLIEALAALTLVLAFAAVLGPLLFHARRIIANADGRVAAQILLRSLLDGPIDRAGVADLTREGETEGLRWRITAEPTAIVAALPPQASQLRSQNAQTDKPPVRWTAYRLVVRVSWAPAQFVSAETVRLGRRE